MNIEDLKEAVSEIMNEYGRDVTQQALDDHERETSFRDANFRSLSSKASPTERKVLKRLAKRTYRNEVDANDFKRTLQITLRELGIAEDDFTLDHDGTAEYICSVVAIGQDGHFIRLGDGKPEACPTGWGAQPKPLGSGSGSGDDGDMDKATMKRWLSRMPAQAKQVWRALGDVYDDAMQRGRTLSFDQALSTAIRQAGVGRAGAGYIQNDLRSAEAVAKQQFMLEGKKRGFGEGDPPEEEIYKKREVVQEIDAETPDAAKELGDASKEQGDTTQGVADAHTRGAEAAKQRQDASKAWKDAKITQIKAVDAAEKQASEEAKASDAQKQAVDAATKAAAAVEKAQAEKEKYLDIAKQAQEQEKEAASAAEEAAKAEEEAESELADANTAAADAGEERSELETDFGDAINSDEEARGEEDEEKAAEEEEDKKDEQEADKKAKEAEMKAADQKAKEDADAKDKEGESEEDEESTAPEATFTEVLKTMVRQVLSERKWGDESKPSPKTPEKLKAAGITADELRSMVLNTVMQGEEDRDLEMIKLLKDMLDSLQSIEYHTTPVKGAGSQLSQAVSKGWVNEGNNRKLFVSIPSIINELRTKGMHAVADDQESFFKWALGNVDLTMQEIKNEADAQIADLQRMLRKLSDHTTGKEDSLEKQKLRGEVPGHH